jgi:hypothetical protein
MGQRGMGQGTVHDGQQFLREYAMTDPTLSTTTPLFIHQYIVNVSAMAGQFSGPKRSSIRTPTWLKRHWTWRGRQQQDWQPPISSWPLLTPDENPFDQWDKKRYARLRCSNERHRSRVVESKRLWACFLSRRGEVEGKSEITDTDKAVEIWWQSYLEEI